MPLAIPRYIWIRSLEILISLFEGGRDKFIDALEVIRDKAPASSGKPFQEEGYNRTYYSVLWEIMQVSQEFPRSSESITHREFYENLIQYVKLRLS